MSAPQSLTLPFPSPAPSPSLSLSIDGSLLLIVNQELAYIHRCCSTVGYRPNVFSTTLSHLVATNCAHLILPFVTVRERLKEKVEEFFGCEFQLFIEFTGLISWCRGASIGWHSDDNRPYLKQRDFAAVCYLNNHEKDFRGGLFRFKDGQPSSVIPIAGDVLIYTADDRNIHAVDEVVDGERLTLTLWFTRNPAHDEDSKLTSFLSRWLLEHERGKTHSFLPLPGSDNMYWFSDGKLGFEIRCARAQNLGFKFYRLKHQEFCDAYLEDDPLEQLSKPVRIGRSDEIFDMEFVNSLHALQVLLFYHLKAHELMASREKNGFEKESTKLTLLDAKDVFELKLPCDHQLAERILGCLPYDAVTWHFCWDNFVLAVSKWEVYMGSLHEELLMLIPQWVDHQTIFNVGTLEQHL